MHRPTYLAIMLVGLLAQQCSGSRRLYGASAIEIERVPWTAALMLNSETYLHCGASIIANSYVLTAAHCVHNNTGDKLYVKYGTKTPEVANSGVAVAVIERHVHPDYRAAANLYAHDLAVLKLEAPIKFSKRARSIVLRSVEALPPEIALLLGWGITESGSISSYLRSVYVPIGDRDFCWKLHLGYNPAAAPYMVCSISPGKGQCGGDSGGPATINGQQVGVMSWISGVCGDRRLPMWWTNVPVYRFFINKATGNTARWSTITPPTPSVIRP